MQTARQALIICKLPGTSMPHVLWELQGYQAAHFSDHQNEDGSITTTFEGFEQVTPGKLDSEDYDDFVRDTVNFLAYIAEPFVDLPQAGVGQVGNHLSYLSS